MPKKEKIEKHKHYFTLDLKTNEAFENFVKKNAISKPKLLEILVIEYLTKNNVKIDDQSFSTFK